MQKVLANEMKTLTTGLMAQEAEGPRQAEGLKKAEGLKDACLCLGVYL
ncbi:MAG: hypothetical protein AAF243_02025 [Cyanobacteria bacterium P01_A01_bin.137]